MLEMQRVSERNLGRDDRLVISVSVFCRLLICYINLIVSLAITETSVLL